MGEMLYAIGLDLGGTQLKYGIVSEAGNIEFDAARRTSGATDPVQVLETMAAAIDECLSIARQRGFTIVGAGAGCPGAIDTETGVSLGNVQHLPAWEGVGIKEFLERECRLPLATDNDANLMTLAESRLGAARGFGLVVGVTLGTGIGGGFVIDGEVYHGRSFNAAEVGHVVIEVDGRPCACGGRGCMTMYCGAAALVGDAATALAGDASSVLHQLKLGSGDATPTTKQILEACDSGDALAERLVRNQAVLLAAGLTSVVNLLNPDVIVLGGGMSESIRLIDQVRLELGARSMRPMNNHIKVLTAQFGNRAGMIGGALRAFETSRA